MASLQKNTFYNLYFGVDTHLSYIYLNIELGSVLSSAAAFEGNILQ